MIEAAIWLCGILVGLICEITIHGSIRRQALMRAQIDMLEREKRALRAKSNDVTIQYTVQREGVYISIMFEHGDLYSAKYYFSDATAAQLVSAIVSKFTA